jgi:hypothetical protein
MVQVLLLCMTKQQMLLIIISMRLVLAWRC